MPDEVPWDSTGNTSSMKLRSRGWDEEKNDDHAGMHVLCQLRLDLWDGAPGLGVGAKKNEYNACCDVLSLRVQGFDSNKQRGMVSGAME
jgi:hypothetical protein